MLDVTIGAALVAGLLSFASRFLDLAARFKKHMRVEIAMLLVATGLLFVTGQMSRIAQWLIETFPSFATIG